MTLFDILALGLIGVSAVVSMMRGVVAEVASLITWVMAFVVAKMFAAPFANLALSGIQPPGLAVVVAFVLLFAAAWLAQYFLRALFTSAVAALGLGGVNRLLGGVFGAIKGVVLVTLAVLVCAFTDLPKSPQWQHAQTAFVFEQLAQQTAPYLPPFVAERVHYPVCAKLPCVPAK